MRLRNADAVLPARAEVAPMLRAALEGTPCPWLSAVVALRLRQHRAAARLARGEERVRAESRAYAAQMERLVPSLLGAMAASVDGSCGSSALRDLGEAGGELAAELDQHVGQLEVLQLPGRELDVECALHEREMLGLLGSMLLAGGRSRLARA